MKKQKTISFLGWILYFVILVFALDTGFLCQFVYNEIGFLLLLIVGFGAVILANTGKTSIREKLLSPNALKMFLGLYGVILLILLFGMRYSAGQAEIGFSSDYIKNNSNWIPFTTIRNNLNTHSWKILIGNLLLFLPIGALCPMIWKAQRKKRYFFGTMLIMSLLIERIQVITGLGSFDIDDMICYLIGSSLGFIIAAHWKKR